jgi:ketosteroid isomerase-like protein
MSSDFIRTVLSVGIGLSLVGLALGRSDSRDVSGVDEAEPAIRSVLEAQVLAWNRGDVDAFMEGYDRSPSTRFASGGSVTRGWETVRDRYRRNYDSPAKMGKLEFTDLEVTVLSPERALAFGRWKLTRESDTPNGLFTLVFARTKTGWKIVADHTSSAE